MVEFHLKLKLILRIITYLTYICWEIDNFVIKSDIFRRFFICKNILKKLSCYHDNNFRYFMFGKYNGFVSKARVSACMYFLVIIYYTHYIWVLKVMWPPGARAFSRLPNDKKGKALGTRLIFHYITQFSRAVPNGFWFGGEGGKIKKLGSLPFGLSPQKIFQKAKFFPAKYRRRGKGPPFQTLSIGYFEAKTYPKQKHIP
jgi:hypothetical protein